MADPRPRNLPAGTLIPVTATRPTFLAPAKDAGFDRADGAFQNFGDFLVTQAFEVAQNHRAAKNIGNMLQRFVNGHLNFQRRELLERRGTEILDFDAALAFFRFGVDGNMLLKMTLEPALVIQRFANRDAGEPRFQRAALAETANAAKGLQENFLGAVGGIGSIAKHAENEVIDRCMIVSDEPVEGRLRARLQLVDEFGFIAAPAKGTSPIGHCRPFRPDIYQHPLSMATVRRSTSMATVRRSTPDAILGPPAAVQQ